MDLGTRLDLNGASRSGPGITGPGDLAGAKPVGVEPTLGVTEGQLVIGKELTIDLVVINGDDGKDQH